MNSFLPVEATLVLPVLGALAMALLLAGRWVADVPLAWVLCLAGVVATEAVTFHEPSGFRMLALVFILLLGMKVIAHATYRTHGHPALTLPAYLCFAVLWLGMKPETFTRRTIRNPKRTARLLGLPVACLLAGLLILRYFPARSWFVLPGLSLAFHFGLINLGAAVWRLTGYPTYALFRNPLRARALGHFWSRLWNLGYVEMIARCVYRPLRKQLPVPVANCFAFLFSGLLHEVAISLPVHRGYGLPTLYFALHGLLTGLEPRFAFPGGRLYVVACLVLPLPLLMHCAFYEEVIVPLATLFRP